METPIGNMLKNGTKAAARFSMPGHKGKLAQKDITEIPGADNLLSPKGCILESQQAVASVYGAAEAFFSVNGSTACVLAMMAYMGKGAKVIVSRDFHVSAANGLQLMGINPVYAPVCYHSGQIPQGPDKDKLAKLMDEHPDAKAVFVTSPNYYGMCGDLEEICQEAHRRNMLMLVDGAHGAHFPFSARLPKLAGEAGADIWSVSCHKTLPSFNQAAVLFCSHRVDGDRLKECLNLFQTTSPSYPILESIEKGIDWMVHQGSAAFDKLFAMIQGLKKELARTAEICRTDDFSRIVVDVSPLGISGFACEEALFAKGIWVEAADERNVILISTVMDQQEDFARLAAVLQEIEGGDGAYEGIPILLDGDKVRSVKGEGEAVCLEAAQGRIAGKPVFAYPPGVPVMLEGQTYTGQKIGQIAYLRNSGYNLMNMDEEGRVLVEK